MKIIIEEKDLGSGVDLSELSLAIDNLRRLFFNPKEHIARGYLDKPSSDNMAITEAMHDSEDKQYKDVSHDTTPAGGKVTRLGIKKRQYRKMGKKNA